MKINSSIQNVPALENRLFWLTVMLIIKFSLLYFLISENRPTQLPDTIAVCSGDCDSYLSPIDNLIESGSYMPDFRMPGYGIPYLFFRSMTGKNSAINLLIVFQTVLDAIAAVLLAVSMYWITRKKSAYYITLLLYGIGITVSCYNNWILTESMTCSVLVIAFYYLLRFKRENEYGDLILSGLFFTWSYFLRPVNFPILIISAVVLFFFFSKANRMKNLFVFLLPALIINSAWSVRNYLVKGKPYLLTENVYIKSWYGEDGLAGLEFCKTFSDFKISFNYFDERGLTYFGQAYQRYSVEDIVIPKQIYTPDFNEDSLLQLRYLFHEKTLVSTTAERASAIESILKNKFELYTASIKKYHPYIVYVKTPLLLTKSFLMQSGVHNLYFRPYSQQPFSRKIIKLFFVLIYLVTFGLFLSGLIFYKKLFDNKLLLLSYAIAFYIIFIHSLALRSIEPRYLIPAYPFFVIGAVFTINTVINSLTKKHVND